ncbi:MAG: VWA domain-containing protein [Chloroflexi bacterium]|nr:VWA domain-containing protein [Chloroflexota bacterium]
MSSSSCNTRRIAISGLLVLIVWLFLLSAGMALGNQTMAGEPRVDLLILVDASGSMDVFDQDRLADKAARYILDHLPQDTSSRIAVACFGTSIEPVLTMTPVVEARKMQPQQVYRECVRTKRPTDFVNVLNQVLSLFEPRTEPANQKVVLLLTDGHPSPYEDTVFVEDEKDRNYLETSVATSLAGLRSKGIEVRVIGIGCTESGSKCVGPTYKSPKFEGFWSKYDLTILRNDNDLPKVDSLLGNVYASAVTPTGMPSLSPSPFIPTALTSTPQPFLTETPSAVSTLSPSPTHRAVGQTTPTAPVETPVPKPTEGWHDRDTIWAALVLVLMLVAGIEGVMLLRQRAWTLEVSGVEEKVRQALQEAQKYEKQGDKRSADKAYNRVLELLGRYEVGALTASAQESRKAWLGKIHLREGLAEQREVIFNGAKTGTKGQLMGLADALKVRWAQQPELILEEIYGLLANQCQPDLLSFLSEPGVPPEVGDKAQVVHWIQETCSNMRVAVNIEKG